MQTHSRGREAKLRAKINEWNTLGISLKIKSEVHTLTGKVDAAMREFEVTKTRRERLGKAVGRHSNRSSPYDYELCTE